MHSQSNAMIKRYEFITEHRKVIFIYYEFVYLLFLSVKFFSFGCKYMKIKVLYLLTSSLANGIYRTAHGVNKYYYF